MKFVFRVVRFYGISLIISLLACWGATWLVFEILNLFDALYIGRSIWFESGLATVEVLTCMYSVEMIRRILIPLDEDVEEATELIEKGL